LGIFTGRECRSPRSGRRKELGQNEAGRGHDTRSRDDSAGQDEALLLTEDGRYRHVPIVNGSKVVGVVSRFGLGEIELDRLDGETGLWERI
jgi:hypothetical protein